MNKKQLILVIVLGLVLGGAGLFVMKNRQSSFSEGTQRMGSKLLGDYDINAIAAIRIQNASNTVNLVKAGDVWTLEERAGYPANFGTLRPLLLNLRELKVAKAVRVGPSRLPVLELVPPDKNGAGVLMELKDSSGKTTKSLLLGAKHMREATGDSPFGGDSAWPDGRYVMVDGNPENIALVSDPLTQVEPRPQDWISKDWFKVEKLKSVSLVSTNATNNWKVARETEAGPWKLVDAKPGEELDTSKSSSVTSALSYPSFNDVATNDSPEVTGLDQPIVATLETFDDFVYTVKIGDQTADDNYYVQVDVAGNFPKTRPPGKDEKEEDKERLDKEFQEQLKKLEDKLKAEEACEKWTYLVSKWTIDPFFKVRSDLLAEKKDDEKKADEKKEAGTAGAVLPVPPMELPGLDGTLPVPPPPPPVPQEPVVAPASPAPETFKPAPANTNQPKIDPVPFPEPAQPPAPKAPETPQTPEPSKEPDPPPAPKEN